jgi:uncharacterized RDD family membrane protein YckC
MNTNNIEFVSFWKRLSALLIDYFIIFIAIAILGNIMHFSGYSMLDKETLISTLEQYAEKNPEKSTEIQEKIEEVKASETFAEDASKNKKSFAITILILEMCYFTLLFSSKKQATIGQRIFKIMVVSKKYGNMKIWTSLLRYICMKITILTPPFYGVGFISIPFSKEKAALYDIISDTRLVNSYLTKEQKNK